MARDTIFALSSGPPPAGIAVVRISGPAARAALLAVAGRVPEARRATLVTLRDGAGEPLDRALVLWMPGPATATGEDMAELHLHGGRAVVAAMLGALAVLPGLSPAEPGAFTRRAFLNGRIDLTEAEGLADLLAAETEGQRRHALRLAEGGLSRLIEGWRTRLLMLAARIEAAIEFGEDEADVAAIDHRIDGDIAALADEIGRILAAPPAERLCDGLRIVVAGPPNAGKSSLVNYLAGRDVAIAAAVPGTTRDLIEAPIQLDGVALLLIDSAGVRDSDDEIERIGIDRARAAMAAADLILWLGAPESCPDRDRSILVHAQCDRHDRMPVPAAADIAISTVTGEGMAALRDLLIARSRSLLPAEDGVALHRRHRAILEECREALESCKALGDPILLAEQLGHARRALDRATGQAGVEEMLDALFGRFCIGK